MKYWIGLVLITIICGCEETSELGIDLVDTTPEVYFTDTTTVSLSTVIMDSLPTNGLGRQLVGSYFDTEIGTWEATSYFQLGLNGRWSLEDDHVYDSIRLIIHYDGYAYGDTLAPQTLEVFQIAESFEPDEGSRFYNTSSLAVWPQSIGSLLFTPRPQQQDSLVINIDDQLGAQLFALAQADDERVTELAEFLEFFRGISLSSKGAGAVLGFEASPERCYLEVYYHQRDEQVEELSYRFPLWSTEQQFNAINGDHSQTLLANLDSQRDQLLADQSDLLSFVQGGTGIMTRIEFPHIRNIAKTSGFAILSAQLEIVPFSEEEFTDFPLPQQLIMAQSDDFNTVGPLISVDYANEAQVSILQQDAEFGSAYYRFSLTEYLDLHLYQEDQGSGLLLALPTDEFPRSSHRLKLDGLQTKLLITYLITQ